MEQVVLDINYRYVFKNKNEYKNFVEHLKMSNFLLYNQIKTAAQTQKLIKRTDNFVNGDSVNTIICSTKTSRMGIVE